MAIEQPQDPTQAAEAPVEPQAQPATPIDLEADPFGEFGEGEQVAGMGRIVRELIEKFAGKRARPRPKAAPGAPGAPTPPGKGMEPVKPPEPPSGQMVPADDVIEAEPALPEVVLGTTRPLANLNYFDNPNTRELLGLLQEKGRTPRGTSWTRTKAEAKELRDLGRMIDEKPSLNWSPAQLTRLRGLLETQAQELHTFSRMLQDKKRQGIDISTEERAMFAQMSSQLVATQNSVSGLSSQAAQLLNSLKIDIKGDDWTPIAKLIDQSGGAEVLDKKIELVANAQPGRQLQMAVKDSWLTKSWGGLMKLRYNMLLSSPRTHAKNILGSASALTYEKVLIDPLAYINNQALVGISAAGRKLKLPNWFVEQELPPRAVASSLHGTWMGMREGVGTFMDIMQERELQDFSGKFANELGMRYRPGEMMGSQSNNRFVRSAGQLASMPTKLLEAEDAFFRSAAYRSRLHTLAMDRAHIEAGGDMALREQRYQQLVDEPPKDLRAQATEYSQKLTFTNDPSMYGKFWGQLYKSAHALQKIPPFQVVMPFVRTPANLLAYMTEMAGVNPSYSRMIEQLQGSPRERAELLARMEASIGIAMGVYGLWANGVISGMGSSNWRTSEMMKTQGWQPNSLNFGGTIYSMNGLDPTGQLLSTWATVFELAEEARQHDNGVDVLNVTMGVLLSTSDMMMDKSYLAGITEVVDIIGNQRGAPGEANKQLGNLIASSAVSTFVPNTLRDFRRMDDPVIRDMGVTYSTETDFITSVGYRMQKLVANMVPGLSDDLPPRFDWKGDVMTMKGNMLARGFSPIEITEEGPDAATLELLDNNVVPSRPKRRIEVPYTGGKVYVDFDALDPSGVLAASFSRDVGQARKKIVEKIISSGAYTRAARNGDVGYAESIAAKMLSDGMSQATREVKQDYLKSLRDGDTFKICTPDGDCSMQWTPNEDHRDAYNWRHIIREYQRHQNVMDSPGIKGKSKVSPRLPDWMLNEKVKF